MKPAALNGPRGRVSFSPEAIMFKRIIYRGMPTIMLLAAAATIQFLAFLAFV
jgi:hypothetical protein